MSTEAGQFRNLLPPNYTSIVQDWLREDCPSFDVGGFVVGDKEETAHLLCKTSGVLAGVPWAEEVFNIMGLQYEWHETEGTYIDLTALPEKKKVIATITGKCRNVLLAERTALNILSRASGIATAARRAQQQKEAHGWHGFVAGTRKTTPGFSKVEKYALLVGGVATHRLDLSQMVMLKDNHIWSTGSITNAVKLARKAAGFSSRIEVECQSVEEACEAAAAGADIVMLDNFSSEDIEAAAAAVKKQYSHILIEASGGITEENLPRYMNPSVDIISRGSFTQGYACLDFSMKIAH